MLFKDNTKLTIITVSEFLGTTQRREIRLTRQVDGRQVYAIRGKKKEYYFDLKPDMLVFDGWGVPVKVDTDTNQFEGNGCFNFLIGKYTEFKQWLLANNLNGKFNQWDLIHYQLEALRGGHSVPLFTEREITELSHG